MPNRRKLFTCCFLLFFPISPAFVGQQRRLRLFLQMATDSSPTMNPCKDGLVKIGAGATRTYWARRFSEQPAQKNGEMVHLRKGFLRPGQGLNVETVQMACYHPYILQRVNGLMA